MAANNSIRKLYIQDNKRTKNKSHDDYKNLVSKINSSVSDSLTQEMKPNEKKNKSNNQSVEPKIEVLNKKSLAIFSQKSNDDEVQNEKKEIPKNFKILDKNTDVVDKSAITYKYKNINHGVGDNRKSILSNHKCTNQNKKHKSMKRNITLWGTQSNFFDNLKSETFIILPHCNKIKSTKSPSHLKRWFYRIQHKFDMKLMSKTSISKFANNS